MKGEHLAAAADDCQHVAMGAADRHRLGISGLAPCASDFEFRGGAGGDRGVGIRRRGGKLGHAHPQHNAKDEIVIANFT